MDTGFFYTLFRLFSLITSFKSGVFRLFQRGNKGVHPGSAFPLHLLRDVAVYIQRKGRCVMAEIFPYRFDIIPGANRGNRV